VSADIAQDAIRSYDPTVDDRPERPFRFTRGLSPAATYLLQRRLFDAVLSGHEQDPLAVEEAVVFLLDKVIAAVYGRRGEYRISQQGP
jgi:hypothetical protein